MIRKMWLALLVIQYTLPIALAQPVDVAEDQPQANVHWYKGSYEYGLLNSDVIRGTEDWTITVHPDGSRTVETMVDLREQGHQSNAIMRVDNQHRLLDAYSSFWRFGEYRGAARFWVEVGGSGSGDMLHNDVIGPLGHATHSVPVPDLFSLRLHPVIIEGWQVWYFDRAKPGPQTYPIYNMVTTGTTGVQGIGMFQDNVVDFKGIETVETVVGTFQAEHFTFYDGRYDIWLWGEHKILVRYIVPSNGREYRLVRFEKGP
ncbi:MAG: hypothetical protein ACJZ9F_03090 [Rhodospirillaceae bacterium]